MDGVRPTFWATAMLTRPFDRIVGTLRRTAEAGLLIQIDDAELLERYTAGKDAAAFEAIVRRHGPLVSRFGRI